MVPDVAETPFVSRTLTVVVPAATLVSTPNAVIDATAGLALVQVNGAVPLDVDKATDAPIPSVAVLGEIANAVTVMDWFADAPAASRAVIVVTPPVTLPTNAPVTALIVPTAVFATLQEYGAVPPLALKTI
jgi:hypothetical protein